MRRTAIVILVVLVVLAVVAVVADRLIVARTESALLDAARERVDLAEGSDVEIDGFPFLTQVLAGELAEVRGTAPALVAEGLELRDVRVTVRGVAPQEPYPAENVEINALVPVTTLRSVIAQAVDLPGDSLQVDVAEGLLQLGVQLLGIELTAAVDPVVLDDGAIGLELGEVQVGDASVPDEGVDVLGELLSNVRLEVPGLPEGLEPTRLAVEEGGLEVRLEGSDVELGEWATGSDSALAAGDAAVAGPSAEEMRGYVGR